MMSGGWRGKVVRRYELLYWSLSCCASVFRSHLHRDLNLPTSCARIQGNPPIRHKELAMHPVEQNGLEYLFILITTWKLSIKSLKETWLQFTIQVQACGLNLSVAHCLCLSISCWSSKPTWYNCSRGNSWGCKLSHCTGNNILWWVPEDLSCWVLSSIDAYTVYIGGVLNKYITNYFMVQSMTQEMALDTCDPREMRMITI